MTATCLIVDDESLARRLLTDYVRKIPALELAGICASALEAQAFMQQKPVDILLLDIQMPDLTGIGLLQSLSQTRQPGPVTILTTAYADYALQGYELSVTDYLLKPISFERFFQAITKALDFLAYRKMGNPPLNTQAVADEVPPKTGADYLFVKVDYRIQKVRYVDILFVEAYGEYVRIHTETETLLTLLSLSRLTESLPPDTFVRVHRSYLINLTHLDSLQGNTLYIGHQQIPLSKSYREPLMELINRRQLF
ncbi:LytR/AlgR family response regulator transcription factor [Spirosoma radiotolerans]|uniref:LytTR family transcriptional regulator n=1 Tax=Spirosoma radiotolerans TaxID=1379870 RepID=A0A0E3ZTB1_9BACT|nr:LytTR family DNA-binding domain-containing protein [Spirosoma radiotolerans]AKD54848.1 hypothetical protein SD10_07935 [Spirosoma radiotolerans]